MTLALIVLEKQNNKKELMQVEKQAVENDSP